MHKRLQLECSQNATAEATRMMKVDCALEHFAGGWELSAMRRMVTHISSVY